MAKYLEIELLVQVGEYAPGADPLADQALRVHPQIREFLAQGTHDRFRLSETTTLMQELADG